MPIYASAPNKTEFFDNLADLLAEYNGTLPGSNIPNAVVGDGAFWTLAVAMLAMGLATDPAQVLKYLKKPVGPLIGMLCQFVIMPCLAMIFLAAAKIGTYEALVIMLYGCAPGGGISNIIIYYMGGDLDLSIAMTMLSCILALGLTPAWLQVVPLMVNSEDEIAIPFAEIGTTLAAVIVPAFIGSFIHWLGQRYKFSKIVKIANILLAGAASLTVIAIVIIGIYKYYLTAIITVSQVVYAAFLPFFGFGIATFLSFSVVKILQKCSIDFKFDALQHMTIGVETAVQNGRMVNAITLVLYSAKEKLYENSSTFFFPIIAISFQIVFGIVLIAILRIPALRKKIQRKENEDFGLKNIGFSEN